MFLRFGWSAARVPDLSATVAVDGNPGRPYRCAVRKILILDEDTPFREALVAQLRQMTNAEIVLASDAAEVVAAIREDYCAAVLVDISLIDAELPRVLAAVRNAAWRPLVLLVTKTPAEDLDPELISLVVRKPYEVPMVTGILLAAISDMPPRMPSDGDVANPPRR